MTNKQTNAGIAAIVYILTVMWIMQDTYLVWWSRMFYAVGFFLTVGFVYIETKNKKP